MTYNEYVEFCLRTYKEALEKPEDCNLRAIIEANLCHLSRTYISPSEIEDLLEDIELDVREQLVEK